MGVEIERKFLVADRAVLDGLIGTAYRQGYLSTAPERTVRVRHAGETAFLTVKSISIGASRAEFEYPIPVADVDALLALCERPIIEKVRYRIGHAGLVWEVDVFGGDNAGLVVAEVEIPSLQTAVEVPAWVGAEVTDDPRYFNAYLVSNPFSAW
jgi:adenylate cyclase